MGKMLAACVVACVAACNSKPSGSARTEITETPVDPPVQPVVPEPPAVAPDAAEAVGAPTDTPVACLSASALVTALNLRGKELRGCFDENADGKPDHCVRWRKDTGAVISVEPVFDVEATDAKLDPAPPVEFHTQDVNDDDRRLELVDDAVDICPPDRSCMRIKPLLADGQEVSEVFADGPYRTAVISIKSSDDDAGRLEFWDLQTGRLRARQPLKSAPTKVRMSNSAVLVFLTADDGTRGTLYGLDGTPHGAFAGGAHDLDPDGAIEVGDAYAIVDDQPDKPPVIYVTSIATGQTVAKLTVARVGTVTLHPLGALVIANQVGDTNLRIDVIDFHTKTSRTLLIPSC